MGRKKNKKGKEKQIQCNQIPQSANAEPKPEPEPNSHNNNMMAPFQFQPQEVLDDSSLNTGTITNPNLAPPSGWGYCTENQLAEFLLHCMRTIYGSVVSQLVYMGYDRDVAVKAILKNGNWHGDYDVATNILQNTLNFLNIRNSDVKECASVFSELNQVEDYSLASMITMLQQLRPGLSRGDAMYCLLVSEFHFGRARTMEIPIHGKSVSSTAPAPPPPLNVCDGEGKFRYEGGSSSSGAEMNLQLRREIEIPKRFNLSPSLQSLLKRNVAVIATGFRAHLEQMQSQAKAFPGIRTGSKLDSLPVSGAKVSLNSVDCHNVSSQDAVNLVLSKFRDLNLDENLESEEDDPRDSVIATLEKQIEDLEKQVKERKDWAHQKAIQAVRTLSSELNELRMLKMDRAECQKIRKGKQELNDLTYKTLEEMESFMRKTNGQMEQANAAMERLLTENAEIKAEIEASKLSAAESVAASLQIEKREKKLLKRLQAWEKQKAKLQQEISDVKTNVLEVQEELARVEQCEQEAEAKWREASKAKEDALALVEVERRAKEAAEANSKRDLKALRLKIETDFQRRKDDLLRLEKEISQLKASNESVDLCHQPSILATSESKDANSPKETIAKLLEELDNLGFSEIEVNGRRQCIICTKGEVSILFLPCAHQIMCASCSEEYTIQGKTVCPSCRVPIEEIIRVFGASS